MFNTIKKIWQYFLCFFLKLFTQIVLDLSIKLIIENHLRNFPVLLLWCKGNWSNACRQVIATDRVSGISSVAKTIKPILLPPDPRRSKKFFVQVTPSSHCLQYYCAINLFFANFDLRNSLFCITLSTQISLCYKLLYIVHCVCVLFNSIYLYFNVK